MNGWFGREAIVEFIARDSNEAAPWSGVLSDCCERNEQPPGLADPGDINTGGSIEGVGEAIDPQNGGLFVTPWEGLSYRKPLWDSRLELVTQPDHDSRARHELFAIS